MVSVRAALATKQGASSAAIAASSTGVPRSSASARPARRAEPTRVTSQPAANSRISARVYSRLTVASVPSTDTRLVREAAQAGLIAGTVPTNGTTKRARDQPVLLDRAIGKAGIVGHVHEMGIRARLGDLAINGEPAETGTEEEDAGRGDHAFQGEPAGQDGNRIMAGMGSEGQRAELDPHIAHVRSPALRRHA